MQKSIEKVFIFLLFASLFAPFIMFKELMFPYVTSKAFYFRIVIELLLPFYVYLIVANKHYRPNLKNPVVIFTGAFVILSLISALLGVNAARSLWGNFERMGGVFYLVHLVLLVFYILLVGEITKDKSKRSLENILVGLFGAALLVGIFVFSGLSVPVAITAALVISGICLFALWRSENFLRAFLELIIFISLLTVVNGIFNKLGWVMLYKDSSLPTRVSSVFGNPIFFASFLILPLSFSLFFAFVSKELKSRIYYFGAAILMLFGIYQSATRGALVGVLVGGFVALLAFLILSYKNKKTKKVTTVIFFAALIFISSGFIFSKSLPEGNLRRIFNLNDSNTQSRLIQWKAALAGFKDAPLVGVGPENYYVISDKYYNPELYQYDVSWFDKPHNYFLEVLATGGILGLVSFVGILVAVIIGALKAFKNELITAGQFSAILGGFIAYNVQNFFVFDTVSASIVFFAFVGFAAHLYQKTYKAAESQPQISDKLNLAATFSGVVLLVAIAYVLYAGNFAPLRVARAVLYGRSYGQVDYKTAAMYFEKARNLPFNFDKIETAGRFADYATGLTRNSSAGQDLEFVKKQTKEAYEYQKQVAEGVGNYALAWLRLGDVKIVDDIINERPLNEETEVPLKRGLELVPNRTEMWQLLLRLRGYQQDWKGALEVAEKIYSLNPYQAQLKLQLGIAHAKAGDVDKGANLALESIKNGYDPVSLNEFYWAANYFFTNKEYEKAIPLMEIATTIEPNNLDNYFLLADSYAKVGQKDKAIVIAGMIAKSDPSQKEAVEEFIKSIK